MTLEPLPEYRKKRVIVGTTVRKSLPILQAYLNSLAWQEKSASVQFEYCFVADFSAQQQDALAHLKGWLNFHKGVLLEGAPQTPQPDFAEGPGLDSHQWTPSSMARVGYNKNLIVQYALNSKADALWFVDADLILDRYTFLSLDSAEKPINTAVYWTRWSKRSTETQKVSAAPQVWLSHPYQLEGRGLDAAEFRRKLVDRQLTRVWGFGACTLIQRRVLESGVNFEYLPDVPTTGMMAGEDRHFSIRAERAHIDAYADPFPDIFHVYHDEDIQQIPAMVERLGRTHPLRAGLGDSVSLRLHALEPLPVSPGRYQQIGPQFVRGRLAQLPLEPELEEAVLSMERGQKQVVRVHHPSHHPMPYLRNRVRLYELTLIDVKENRPAPVIDEELFVGVRSGRSLDGATLSSDQLESLAEVVNA